MPIFPDDMVIKTWELDDGKIISAVVDNGKLYFYMHVHNSSSEPILIDSHDIHGISSEILKRLDVWKKFLEDSRVRLSTLNDGSVKLYINGRLKGGGNTIDPVQESSKLWPSGIIPYLINSTEYPEKSDRKRILVSAINEWNMAGTGFRLVPRIHGQTDYLVFGSNTQACNSSAVGRQGRTQYIRCDLGIGRSFDKSSIIHEIGHVAGLYHEQQRFDRDTYVEVSPNASSANYGQRGIAHGQYDFFSIMHYPFFSRELRLRQGVSYPPSLLTHTNESLSSGDIDALRDLARAAGAFQGVSISLPPPQPSNFAVSVGTPYPAADTRPPAQLIFQKALQAMQQNDYQLGFKYLGSLIREYGDEFQRFDQDKQVNIYFNYGICLEKFGHYPDALSWFEKAQRLAPGNIQINEHIVVVTAQIQSNQPSCLQC